MPSTRREFLRDGWKLGGTLLVAAAGWTRTSRCGRSLAPQPGRTINLGNPSNYSAGTATYVSEGRLFVANTGSTSSPSRRSAPTSAAGSRSATRRVGSSARATARSTTSAASGSRGRRPEAWTASR